MKKLFLLRHAKSSWDDPTLSDFDRPLNRRGRSAAPAVGQYMAAEDLTPSLVLCSAAQRTRETMALLLPSFSDEMVIQIERGLYEASAERLFARLRKIPDSVPSVLLIGHNPGLEELAQDLTSDGPAEAIAQLSAKYPTAALAVIRFRIDAWSQLTTRSGTLERFVIPPREARER